MYLNNLHDSSLAESNFGYQPKDKIPQTLGYTMFGARTYATFLRKEQKDLVPREDN